MSELIRIDKFLSNRNFGSRKEVKALLRKGMVSVDKNTINDEKYKIRGSEIIEVCGKQLFDLPKKYYIMLNKPEDVVSATRDEQQTVIDLIDEQHKDKNIFPVGRLDKDTTGLLILTNDGNFAHKTLSPNNHVPKKYYVKVEGVLNENHIQKFFDGIALGEEICESAKLSIINSSEVSECVVTITEGKYHQIKRMFHSIDCEVIKLKRLSFGDIKLDEKLEYGQYRFFNECELEYVKMILN